MKQTSRGFTLVEMLVVVSIISLLSSVVLSTVNGVRKKAGNTQRVKIIEEYRKALLLGYDKYGGYPKPGSVLNASYCLGNPPLGICNTSGSIPVSPVVNSVAGEFIPPLPVQSKFTVGVSTYYGPFYACNAFNSSADDKGACSKATIIWFMPDNGTGSAPPGICNPGVTAGVVGGFPVVPLCNLVIE